MQKYKFVNYGIHNEKDKIQLLFKESNKIVHYANIRDLSKNSQKRTFSELINTGLTKIAQITFYYKV